MTTTAQLTRTEAETLAVMLTSGIRKMSRVKARVPGTDRYDYVWDDGLYATIHDTAAGFSDIVPAEYAILL